MPSQNRTSVLLEIAQTLQSGRMFRITSVPAQLFHLVDDSWKELTQGPIMVHLYHDSLEDVTKMLAINVDMQFVIDNAPVASNFHMTRPSNKFLHYVSNKFDLKKGEVYGFGFSSAADMDQFYAHLDRIRSSAMASLNPTFHMNNHSANSSPQTTPRTARRAVLQMQRAHSGLAAPSAVPFGFLNTPLRNSNNNLNVPTSSPMHQTSSSSSLSNMRGYTNYNNINNEERYAQYSAANLTNHHMMSSFPMGELDEANQLTQAVEQQYSNAFSADGLDILRNHLMMSKPHAESTPLTSPHGKVFSYDHQFSANSAAAAAFNFGTTAGDALRSMTNEDYHSLTERVLGMEDLMPQFDSCSLLETPMMSSTSPSPFRSSNPAGAIGTPVKGIGGIMRNVEEDESHPVELQLEI